MKYNLKLGFTLGIKDIFTLGTCDIRNKENKDFIIPTRDVDASIIITKYFIKHFIHTAEGQTPETF